MNTLTFIAVFSMTLGAVALFFLPRLHEYLIYRACKISITVKDLDTNKEITVDYNSTSNDKISAANWTAKLSKESIVRMVKLYPHIDISRLDVRVNSAKYIR